MHIRRYAAIVSFAVLTFSVPASAEQISIKECSAKFRVAKESGNAAKWTEFRKTECGIDPEPTRDTTGQALAATPRIISDSVTFPPEVDQKFASETPAKQRQKTCLEAYHANKAASTLDGLRWIEKGGGYYSMCNARLKEAAQ